MKNRFTFLMLCLLIPFLVQAQDWNQIIKAAASDRAVGDYFGYSVSISGNYAIVGAYLEDEDAAGINTMSRAGSAYIFYNNGSTWVQQQKIVASDRTIDDYFGYSVSISGNYAVVGAYGEDHDVAGANYIPSTGSVYIFFNDGSSWAQKQKIVASDRAYQDYFGYSVSISDNYIIVGAYSEDENASGSDTKSAAGSAYIFYNNGSNWTQQQKIVASDRAADDYFGASVSISGNYAIIGAYQEDENASGTNSLSSSGSAYIFYNNGSWVQQQKIVAADRNAEDNFGYAVSISGNYAIVGAYSEDEDVSGSNTKSAAGSAYIFYNDNGNWNNQQKIVASDRALNDNFGFSVSISGKYAIVGAYQEDENTLNDYTKFEAGSAYLFYINEGVWSEMQKIVNSDRNIDDNFGVSVAISGKNVIVGANKEDEDALGFNVKEDAGSAYIFLRNDNTPSIITTAITANLGYTASSGGNIYYDGGQDVTARGVCWNIIGSPSISDPKTSDGAGTGIYTSSITGLIPGTTYYVRAYATNSVGTGYGNSFTFTSPCINPTSGGTISSSQASCNSFDPTEIINSAMPTGQTGTLEYQWQKSTTSSSAGFSYVFNSNSPNYDPPSITTTTWYKRLARVNCKTTWTGAAESNVVEMTVYLPFTVGSISEDHTICYNEIPSELTGIAPSGGNTPYTYQWQNSTDGINFSNISGATNLNYQAGALLTTTYYQLIQTSASGCGTLVTNIVTVTGDIVKPTVTSTHSDKIVYADDNCEAVLPDYTADVVATDNCDSSPTVTQSPVAGTIISGDINTITLHVADDAGNITDIPFNVEVVDVTDPVITSVHLNKIVYADDNCEAILPNYVGAVVATDNCDSELTITQLPAGGTMISGASNLIKLIATDDAGNSSEVGFHVSVVDITKPIIISSPANQSVDTDDNCEAILEDYTDDIDATDNCVFTITQLPAVGTTIFGATNSVKITVTDSTGNFAEVIFNVKANTIPSPLDDDFEIKQTTYDNVLLILDNDDFGCDGDESISIVSNPERGKVEIDDNGTSGDTTDDFALYTPEYDYVGPDSFVYEICDPDGDCVSATVNLMVVRDMFNISKGFSPNADGINDEFIIGDLTKYPKNSLIIINRWGNKVFEASPYNNDWNGTNKLGLVFGNEELPQGTYFYLFNPGNGTRVRKGHFYLKRQ